MSLASQWNSMAKWKEESGNGRVIVCYGPLTDKKTGVSIYVCIYLCILVTCNTNSVLGLPLICTYCRKLHYTTMYVTVSQDLLGINETIARKLTWFLESHEK